MPFLSPAIFCLRMVDEERLGPTKAKGAHCVRAPPPLLPPPAPHALPAPPVPPAPPPPVFPSTPAPSLPVPCLLLLPSPPAPPPASPDLCLGQIWFAWDSSLSWLSSFIRASNVAVPALMLKGCWWPRPHSSAPRFLAWPQSWGLFLKCPPFCCVPWRTLYQRQFIFCLAFSLFLWDSFLFSLSYQDIIDTQHTVACLLLYQFNIASFC